MVVALVLVAPVVILTSGGSGNGSCAQTLRYLGRPYVARAVPVEATVQATAIGVGVTRGCGAPPSNVNIRSLSRIGPALAVAVAGDQSSIYVRRGVCPRAAGGALVACLRGRSGHV